MPLPLVTDFVRSVPGGGTDNIGGVQYVDPTDGVTRKLESHSTHGFPCVLSRIGTALSSAGGHVGKEFPDDGTGVCTAVSANQLQLATSALQNLDATLDPRGWLVAIVSGSGAGQYRVITGWTSGTRTITVAANWTVIPSVGDKYRLLLDCRLRSTIMLAAEYNADLIQADVNLVFYDLAVDGAGNARKPRRAWDIRRTLPYQSIQIADAADGETLNDYVSAIVAVQTRGFVGAKVKLIVAAGSGTTDLYAGGT